MSHADSCQNARVLGIPALAADDDIIGAVREVVEHQITHGAIPPERRGHAVGWCLTWLTTCDPRVLQRYCVHIQAVAAVAHYPHTLTGEAAADV
jgi:hypothetical protein